MTAALPLGDVGEVPQERFGLDDHGLVWREVSLGAWQGPRLGVAADVSGSSQDDFRRAWDQAWLRGAFPASLGRRRAVHRTLTVMDLFSGCGAMSLGLKVAAHSLGLAFESRLAADFEPAALGVYRTNLAPAVAHSGDLGKAVTFRTTASRLTNPVVEHPGIREFSEQIDVLIGGPPCQGHSDLNNHSRRSDPKNSLYLIMPAMALALRPKVVIIENVPAVIHDRTGVVDHTVDALARAGYAVTQGLVGAGRIGTAQHRRRHVLIGTTGARVDLDGIQAAFETEPRPLSWAIGDLVDVDASQEFDRASTQSKVNRKRIDWLFENDSFDLPNAKRPTCHRDNVHSYVSMYGRLRWDELAQTLTSGYGSPGQGRYIHPLRRRTITPHEAARIQFFPDSFSFLNDGVSPGRTKLAVMIGNAVPPKLTYVIGLAALAAASLHLRRS